MKKFNANLQHSFFKQQRMIFFAGTPSGPEGYTPAEQTEDNHSAEKKDEPKDLATQKQEIEDGIQTIMKQGSENLQQYDRTKLVEALNKDTIAELRDGVENSINELKQQSEQIEDNSREALRTTALNALNQISGIIAKSNSPEKQQQAA